MYSLKTIATYAAILATPLMRIGNKLSNEFDFSLGSWNPFMVQPFMMSGTPSTILLCSAKDDVMTVDKVYLQPDPPVKGENLSVIISGMLHENLNEGSMMYVNIKKGIIKFPQLKIPTCEYITNGCPVEKGSANLEMKFELPDMMPSGTYDVKAVLYNNEQKMSEHVHKIKSPKMVKKFLESNTMNNINIVGKRVACAEGQIQF